MTLNPGDTLTLADPTPLPLNADGSIVAAAWHPGGSVADFERRGCEWPARNRLRLVE